MPTLKTILSEQLGQSPTKLNLSRIEKALNKFQLLQYGLTFKTTTFEGKDLVEKRYEIRNGTSFLAIADSPEEAQEMTAALNAAVKPFLLGQEDRFCSILKEELEKRNDDLRS